MKKNRLTSVARAILLVAAGLALGRMVFHQATGNNSGGDQGESLIVNGEYTCSMHPQIRMNEPGVCPLCAMDLILLDQDSEVSNSQAVHISAEAASLAEVMTTVVARGRPSAELRLYGKVEPDERLLQSQVAQVSGRIEKLHVAFSGEAVTRGQLLAEVYSPAILTAQQELLEAAKTKHNQPLVYAAAKEKLRQMKLTEEQIQAMEQKGALGSVVPVFSGTEGIVVSKRVNRGDYVSQGDVLYEMADLSRVWVVFQAYERDLVYLRTGIPVEIGIQAIPGRTFTGNIAFIDPVVDADTRTVRIRTELENPAGQLKPGMFVTGTVRSVFPAPAASLVIPRSAVLWTGTRSIVYVKLKEADQPAYVLREVELGPPAGSSYIVKSGLAEGEEVVTRGTFSVDAAAQLDGKPSMMSHTPEHQVHPHFNHEHAHTSGRKNEPEKADEQLVSLLFHVSGSCEMCTDRIEKAARSLEGVVSAVYDLAAQQIRVDYLKGITTPDALHRVIAESGHDTEKIKAPDPAYNKLPECCWYRK